MLVLLNFAFTGTVLASLLLQIVPGLRFDNVSFAPSFDSDTQLLRMFDVAGAAMMFGLAVGCVLLRYRTSNRHKKELADAVTSNLLHVGVMHLFFASGKGFGLQFSNGRYVPILYYVGIIIAGVDAAVTMDAFRAYRVSTGVESKAKAWPIFSKGFLLVGINGGHAWIAISQIVARACADPSAYWSISLINIIYVVVAVARAWQPAKLGPGRAGDRLKWLSPVEQLSAARMNLLSGGWYAAAVMFTPLLLSLLMELLYCMGVVHLATADILIRAQLPLRGLEAGYMLVTAITQNDEAAALEEKQKRLVALLDMRIKENDARQSMVRYLFHEVRVPMNSVYLGLKLILDEEENMSPDGNETVRVMLMATQTAMGVLSDTLDLSRMEREDVEPPQVDVTGTAELASTVIAQTRPFALGMGVHLSVQVDDDVPEYCLLAKSQMMQVLGNFLTNAVKFTTGRPNAAVTLKISTRPVAQTATSRVLYTVSKAGDGDGEGEGEAEGSYAESFLGSSLPRVQPAPAALLLSPASVPRTNSLLDTEASASHWSARAPSFLQGALQPFVRREGIAAGTRPISPTAIPSPGPDAIFVQMGVSPPIHSSAQNGKASRGDHRAAVCKGGEAEGALPDKASQPVFSSVNSTTPRSLSERSRPDPLSETSAVPAGWSASGKPVHLWFSVDDNGTGIPVHQLPRLFRPFQMLHKDGQSRGRGTGLGLAISRAIARQLGGDVGVWSAEGAGSAFFLKLAVQPVEAVSNTLGISTSGQPSFGLGNGQAGRPLASAVGVGLQPLRNVQLSPSSSFHTSSKAGNSSSNNSSSYSIDVQIAVDAKGRSRAGSVDTVPGPVLRTVPEAEDEKQTSSGSVVDFVLSTDADVQQMATVVSLSPPLRPCSKPVAESFPDNSDQRSTVAAARLALWTDLKTADVETGDRSPVSVVCLNPSITQAGARNVAASFSAQDSNSYPDSSDALAPGPIPIHPNTWVQRGRPAKARVTPQSSPLPPLRILVVDDVASSRQFLARLLRRRLPGCIITEAMHGEECLQEAARLQAADGVTYDLICMDGDMPILDGYGATQTLRSTGFTNLILGCTGNALPADLQRFRDAGADDVLTKPIDPDLVVDRVRSWLHARGSASPSCREQSQRVVPRTEQHAGGVYLSDRSSPRARSSSQQAADSTWTLSPSLEPTAEVTVLMTVGRL